MKNFKITSNKMKRTFTIVKPCGSKYRTISLSKNEFNEMEYNTQNDWVDFLKSNSGSYIVLK